MQRGRIVGFDDKSEGEGRVELREWRLSHYDSSTRKRKTKRYVECFSKSLVWVLFSIKADQERC